MTVACQSILGLRRNLMIDCAFEQSITFHAAKRLYQHLLRDVWYLSLEFVESTNISRRKIIKYDGEPFIADK